MELRIKTANGSFVLGARSFLWGDDPPFQVERLIRLSHVFVTSAYF